MSISTEIEKALQAVDAVPFQKLINEYLRYLYPGNFLSPGTAIAKDKVRKGIPDGFIERNGTFIFIESTTEEKKGNGRKFIQKLTNSIKGCFDKSKTGLEPEEITTVVLAFTSDLVPKEIKELQDSIKSFNPDCNLKLLGIQELALELINYSWLVEKYLNIKIPQSGYVYSIEQFLNKKGHQPSLSNPFKFREEELRQSLDFIEERSILVLAGLQGTGKSKLALEIAERSTSKGYIPLIIQGSPISLADDLRFFIQPQKKYVVVFDDANKGVNNLPLLLRLMDEPKIAEIKLIITVRDYVKDALTKVLPHGGFHTLSIPPFKREEIEEIISSTFPIANRFPSDWMNRIVEVSKNNPRLALMATSAIIEKQSILALTSVAEIYDIYFGKVSEDIGLSGNVDFIKALGIVSFFGTLDKENKELKPRIEKVFKIHWNVLWEAIYKLHDYEILDVHDEAVCRISDQVLGTYAFYKCFFDKRTLQIQYSDLISEFIETYPKRTDATFLDINNTFSYEHMHDIVLPELNKIKNSFNANPKAKYLFFRIYWLHLETDTILYVQEWFKGLNEKKMKREEIKFTELKVSFDSYPNDEPYKILKHLLRHPSDYFNSALNLYLKLMLLQNDRIPKMLKKMKEVISFSMSDSDSGYTRQHQLINLLTKEGYNEDDQFIVDKILMELAPDIIKVGHRESHMSEGRNIRLFSFRLAQTDEFFLLRQKVLLRLFVLEKTFKNEALKIVLKSIKERDIDYSGINTHELPLFEKLITDLSPNNYAHVHFVNEYVDELEIKSVPKEWLPFLDANSWKVSQLLKYDYLTSREAEDYVEDKRKEYRVYISALRASELVDLTLLISEINLVDSQLGSHNRDHLVNYFYGVIAEIYPKEFFDLIKLVFDKKLSIPLNANWLLIPLLREDKINPDDLYNCLNSIENPQVTNWKFFFFEFLDEKYISEIYTNELIQTVRGLERKYCFYNIHRFKMYQPFYKKEQGKPDSIVEFLIEIILEKPIEQEVTFERNMCESFLNEFPNRIDIFKSIYLRAVQTRSEHDYNGEEMSCIIKADPGFALEYIKFQIDRSPYYEFSEEDRIEEIWNVAKCETYVDEIMEYLIKNTQQYSYSSHSANVLFGKHLTDENRVKAKEYLMKFIREKGNSEKKLLVAMNVVTYSFGLDTCVFVKEALTVNKSIKHFKKMHFEKNGILTGSFIPVYKKRVKLLESIRETILSLPDQLDYIEHAAWINEKIDHVQRDIKKEEKEEFEEAVKW